MGGVITSIEWLCVVSCAIKSYSGMSSQLQIPCLGRPFRLGMLYSCHTEKLITGKTLWNVEKLKSATLTTKHPSSEDRVTTEDTIQSKYSSLGISENEANLKLSLMSGMVKVEGASKFWQDRMHSRDQSRVTLHYKATTHFEQLVMDQLAHLDHPKLLEDHDVTHVVTGITYGCDAFFVFDCFASADRGDEISQEMEAAVESILRGSLLDLSKTETDKVRCNFHGDFIPTSNPYTLERARLLYRDLPTLLSNGDLSKAKIAYLTPLSNLIGETQQEVYLIPPSVASQVEEILEHFHSTEMHASDLLKLHICKKFVDIGNQLSKFKKLLIRFRNNFITKLSQMVPSIRQAKADIKQLTDLISSVNESPFNFSVTKKYLNGKEKEIKMLTQHLKNMKRESKLQFVFPDTGCDLTTLANDSAIKHVVCFAFNVTSESSAYLKELESCSLQIHKAKLPYDTEWFDKPEVTEKLRLEMKTFLDFIKKASIKGNAFVATSSNNESGPSTIVFTNGVPKPFDPHALVTEFPDMVHPTVVADTAIPESKFVTDTAVCKPKVGTDIAIPKPKFDTTVPRSGAHVTIPNPKSESSELPGIPHAQAKGKITSGNKLLNLENTDEAKIQSIDKNGESKTPKLLGKPGTPVATSINTDSITLTWIPPAFGKLSMCRVQRMKLTIQPSVHMFP